MGGEREGRGLREGELDGGRDERRELQTTANASESRKYQYLLLVSLHLVSRRRGGRGVRGHASIRSSDCLPLAPPTWPLLLALRNLMESAYSQNRVQGEEREAAVLETGASGGLRLRGPILSFRPTRVGLALRPRQPSRPPPPSPFTSFSPAASTTRTAMSRLAPLVIDNGASLRDFDRESLA